ncbi:MAG: thiol reductant ABC exporter subunit CydC [Hyphomicrobiaceae bacterium]
MALMLRLTRLMWPVRWMMVLSIVLSLLAMLANIGLLAVSGWFIAAMGLAGVAGATMNYFTPAAIIRAFAIVRTGGRYAERVISHEATFRILSGLRRWFYDRLEPLAPAALGEHSSGDLFTGIRNDIERLELVFLRIISPVVVAVLAGLIVISVLTAYHGLSAFAVGVLLIAAGLLLPVYTMRQGRWPSRELTALSSEMKSLLVDGLEGLAELQLAGRDADFRKRVVVLSERQISSERQLAKQQGAAAAAIVLAANLALFAVLLLIVPEVQDGNLASAKLPALMLLALASFDAVAPLPLAFQSLPGALHSARRLFDLADRGPLVKEPRSPHRMPTGNAVRFENVSLSYAPGRRSVLSNVSLELAEGRRIAVVGVTGAGKSSLINLLVRFWDPSAGKITLDGVPINELGLDALRARISVQQQRPYFFSATVRDNLLIARPGATQEHIETATRAAKIHNFIASLPRGYDTFIGAHGRLLSGGEAHRLAVARALLNPAPILVLDEPTEGLDTITAAEMICGIMDFARDRSILLITHRETGLLAMDEIIVLEAGQVVAKGSFDELSRPARPLNAMKSRIDELPAEDL